MKNIAYRIKIDGKTKSGVLRVRDDMTPDEIHEAILEANRQPTPVVANIKTKEKTKCCSNT